MAKEDDDSPPEPQDQKDESLLERTRILLSKLDEDPSDPDSRELPCSVRRGRPLRDDQVQNPDDSPVMPDLTSNLVDKNQDKMIGKLRRFDGTTPWMDYEIQFELCAQMNDWGEKTKLRNLACMLDGEAAQVLSTIGKECSTMDYQDLKDALIRRYSPQHQQEVFRLELKNRRRRKDETIPALANEVRRLVRQGWPEENRTTQEALMRDYFLDALDEPELRKEVEVKQPRDINEAEIMTMRMSSILKGCKVRERRTATQEKERE